MPQKRDAKRTKSIILQTATKLFAQQGIDGVSVDVIAKEAKINKAMIYYYFKNKATLYEVVVENILNEIYQTILKELQQCHRPREELKVFVFTFAKFTQQNSFLSSLMLHELSSGGKELPNNVFTGLKKLFLVLIDILERGYQKGCFKKVEPMVLHFMITGVINLFVTTKTMRENATKEFGNAVCSSCDELEIAAILYEYILAIVHIQ
jgi:AcrR family transcriptional regulator